MSSAPTIRRARESDHVQLIGRINEWWGGRDMALFQLALERGCSEVRWVTSPVNGGSIAFHRRMGFTPEPGDAETGDGAPYAVDDDGPGEHRVRRRRQLAR